MPGSRFLFHFTDSPEVVHEDFVDVSLSDEFVVEQDPVIVSLGANLGEVVAAVHSAFVDDHGVEGKSVVIFVGDRSIVVNEFVEVDFLEELETVVDFFDRLSSRVVLEPLQLENQYVRE